MPALAVEISRFVDESNPGFVECLLVDALGHSHLFVEKVPVVTREDLWSTSTYPRPGVIACEIEAEWKDGAGQSFARVSTELPWHVESTVGQTQFVVLASQLVGR
jgi:hypothetical protein